MQVRERLGHLEELELAEGYAVLGPPFVERREPTPLPEPRLVDANPDVAALLGLGPAELERPEFLALAAGNARFGDVTPFAAIYAGHQFGSWNPQLGDGRAVTYGEVAAPGGPLEWQVKGAGMTAFSRHADGRAVLRSTIREYLCSEAMAGLGIPTTRALAIAASDEPVYRERVETAAVLTRIAPSLLRFGTLEFFAHRDEPDAVRRVADYAAERFFPEAAALTGAERYATMLREIAARTGRLLARWQAVGFAHGVMNTDNMSLLGLTLDYGPFGFLDAYDPGFICNHTDVGGRYAFDRQPTIGLWNVHALAAAFAPLLDEAAASDAAGAYRPAFQATFTQAMLAKFGFGRPEPADAELLVELLTALATARVDYTLAFRTLSGLPLAPGATSDDAFFALWADADAGRAFLARWRERIAHETAPDAERIAAMRSVNPRIVLRNWLAERAIRAATAGNDGEVRRLREALATPFAETAVPDDLGDAPPTWACDLSVSCSS